MKKRMLVLFMAGLCWACLPGIGVAEHVSETIDSNGTWTDPIACPKGDSITVSINPDTSPIMTITLQWKLPGETTWGHDVDTWDLTATSPDQEHITNLAAEYVSYRIGCDSAADYTSGNCTARLGRDNF